MPSMKIEKVLDNLPVTLEANTIYFVKKTTDVETYVSDSLATIAIGFGKSVADPTIEGLLTVTPNLVSNYKITNFDSNTVYTITAINGSVQYTIDTDTIIYTAPGVEGPCGFIVNGKYCRLSCAAVAATETVLVFDTFTDIDGTLLSNHIGEIGAIWTVAPDDYMAGIDTYVIGPASNLVINNNNLSPTTITNSEFYVAKPSGGSIVGLNKFTVEFGFRLTPGVSYSNINVHSTSSLADPFNNKILLVELSDYLPAGNFTQMQLNGNAAAYHPNNVDQIVNFDVENIVKAVYEAGTATLYLNGDLIGSEAYSFTIPSVDHFLTLTIRVSNSIPATNPVTYFKLYEHI